MSYVNNLGAITGGSKSPDDSDLGNIQIQMNDTERADTEAPVQGKKPNQE